MIAPLPNIALFAGSRKWTRDDNGYLWESNDGWVITDLQIRAYPEDGQRVAEMLREHVAKQSQKGGTET